MSKAAEDAPVSIAWKWDILLRNPGFHPLEILLLIGLLALAGRGLFSNYSYWSDEIWSVAASSGSWRELFRSWLPPDTHPPLYQGLLKIWISLLGTTEAATRSLSFLISALAMLAAMLLATVMVGSLLLLSQTALACEPLLLSCLRKIQLRWCLYGSALLLSLTQYFSLVFALVALATATVEGLAIQRRNSLLRLTAAMLIWPTIHILYIKLILSNFDSVHRIVWIQAQPLIGTVAQLIRATFPLLAPPNAEDAIVTAKLAVVAIITITVFCRQPHRSHLASFLKAPTDSLRWDLGEMRFLLLVTGIFLGLATLVDILRPVSYFRYYFACLPVIAFLSGDLWTAAQRQHRWRRRVITALVLSLLRLRSSHPYSIFSIGSLRWLTISQSPTM